MKRGEDPGDVPEARHKALPFLNRAACADPTRYPPEAVHNGLPAIDLFFPERGASTKAAKTICNGDPDRDIPPCEALEDCFEHAVANERFGIWGGTSERERRQIRLSRKRQSGAA